MAKTKFIDTTKMSSGDEKAKKPIEFTEHLHVSDGWAAAKNIPSEFIEVKYLGRCETDGDMFAAYLNGYIDIFKGHLNDGFIEE